MDKEQFQDNIQSVVDAGDYLIDRYFKYNKALKLHMKQRNIPSHASFFKKQLSFLSLFDKSMMMTFAAKNLKLELSLAEKKKDPLDNVAEKIWIRLNPFTTKDNDFDLPDIVNKHSHLDRWLGFNKIADEAVMNNFHANTKMLEMISLHKDDIHFIGVIDIEESYHQEDVYEDKSDISEILDGMQYYFNCDEFFDATVDYDKKRNTTYAHNL